MTDVTEAQVLGEQSAWATAQTAARSRPPSRTGWSRSPTPATGAVSVPITVPPGTTVSGAAFGTPYGGQLSALDQRGRHRARPP